MNVQNEKAEHMRSLAQMASFQSNWHFDRSLSRDLLLHLSDDDLLWSPGATVGPFWKQFRHIGRVQENYLAAVQSGSVKFDPAGCTFDRFLKSLPDKSDEKSLLKLALTDYLDSLDKQMTEVLQGASLPTTIDWFGESVPLNEHLFRLLSHENLHHGQWIVYCQLKGSTYPKSWQIWGLQ